MVRVVHLPDLPRPGGPMLVEFGLDRGEVARMWRLIVAMAVRDGAVSVHWHPWRAADALAYVVGGVRHSLVRPPVALDSVVSAAARELITGGGMWSDLGRRLGWRSTELSDSTPNWSRHPTPAAGRRVGGGERSSCGRHARSWPTGRGTRERQRGVKDARRGTNNGVRQVPPGDPATVPSNGA